MASACTVSPEEGEEVVADAERFVSTVAELFDT